MRRSLSDFVSSWVGLVTGDDGSMPDPIKILSPSGGTSLPQKELAEYMDRMISALVRGADLGTLSRANGEGASLQGKETEALLEDDCALVTEVLQTQLDTLVIRMVHGDEKPLANIVISPPSSQNTTRDLEIDQALDSLGVKQDPEELAERYGRTLADEEPGADFDDPLLDAFRDKDDLVREFYSDPLVKGFAGNEVSGNLHRIRMALAEDLQPLGDALWSAHQTGDMIAMRAALRKISERMPDFLESGALEDLLGEEMIKEWGGEEAAANGDFPGHPFRGNQWRKGWSREGKTQSWSDTLGALPKKKNGVLAPAENTSASMRPSRAV